MKLIKQRRDLITETILPIHPILPFTIHYIIVFIYWKISIRVIQISSFIMKIANESENGKETAEEVVENSKKKLNKKLQKMQLKILLLPK